MPFSQTSNTSILSAEELEKSIQSTLEKHSVNLGVWVFGYGSLMWNPEVHYDQFQPGLLKGYHRQLCIASLVYRGTPEYPGLVLGLAKGLDCQGMIFHIPSDHVQSELRKIWKREMFDDAYVPQWVDVETKIEPDSDALQTLKAITFIANHGHSCCLDELCLKVQAERVAKAHGTRGPCSDYLFNTLEHLRALGMEDPLLESLLPLVKEQQQSLKTLTK